MTTRTTLHSALIGLALLAPGACGAATYHLANSGNDGNSGTNQASPWKTIAKVNAVNFQPGDSILFKRGDTWKEGLGIVITNSGTSANPITYGAYGTGAKPILSLRTPVPGWTNANKWVLESQTYSIWKILLPSSMYHVRGLWLDNVWYKKAHLVTPAGNFPFNPLALDRTNANTYPGIDAEYRFNQSSSRTNFYVYAPYPTKPSEYYTNMDAIIPDGGWIWNADHKRSLFTARNKKYVTIQDLEFHGGSHQLELLGADYFVIRSNVFKYVTVNAIYMSADSGYTSRQSDCNEIYDNLFDAGFSELSGGYYDYYSGSGVFQTFLTIHKALWMVFGANTNRVHDNTFKDFYASAFSVGGANGGTNYDQPYPTTGNYNEFYNNTFISDDKNARFFEIMEYTMLADGTSVDDGGFSSYNRIYNNYFKNQKKDSHFQGDHNYVYFNVWDTILDPVPDLYLGEGEVSEFGDSDNYFFNNTIYNCAFHGIYTFAGSSHTKVLNNLFVNVDTKENGRRAIRDNDSSWDTRMEYKNNVFFYTNLPATSNMVYYQDQYRTIANFNLADSHGDVIEGNLQYVGAMSSLINTDTFSLPAGSTAINAGTDISALVPAGFRDRNGALVNLQTPSVGALEYVAGSLPAAPSNLLATAVSISQINLTWNDHSTNESQFRIERKLGAGAFEFLTNVSANTGVFDDTGLSSSTYYGYRVRAENTNGSSAWTVEAGETTSAAAMGPLAYWRLDEGVGTTAADASGNGYYGTLAGSPLPQWIASPLRGSALQFDGASGGYVRIPNLPANWSSGLTLAAWVNLKSFTNNGRIVARDDTLGRSWGLCAESSSNWNFTIAASASARSNLMVAFVPSATTNRWMHLAGVYDAGGSQPRMKLYTNGVLAGQKDFLPAAPFDVLTNVYIGRRSAEEVFGGTIDEVRIYDRPLSAGDIAVWAAPQFRGPSIVAGQISLDWVGLGQLEWAPAVNGPWTPITPRPAPPYIEGIITNANKFFRLTIP